MSMTNVLSRDELALKERRDQLRRAFYRLTENTLSVIGLIIVAGVILCAVFAPYIAPHPEHATTSAVYMDMIGEPPSLEHPLGTDSSGRDILSRILFGARISLMMGVVVLSIAISIGVTLGLIAGYFGGYVNSSIMRVTDTFLAVPPILLAMVITAFLGPSLVNAMIGIALSWWTWYARIVQGEVLSVKEEQFVEAAESIGAGWVHITFKEILPNIMAPITVKATLDMGFVILVGAALAFLGIGTQPPTPDWGVMIAQGRDFVGSYWWMATFPGLAISITVLGFNLLGDGLRDLLDVEVE